MTKHYLIVRRVPTDLLLRLAELRGGGTLHKAEKDAIFDLLKDFQDALHLAQRDVFTLQQECDRLRMENEFLLAQLQMEEA